MTEGEARTIYESFCAEKGRKPTSSSAKPEPDGSWRFVEMEGQGTNGIYEGVVVPTFSTSLPRLCLKGTGDGVMIVSQADWHKSATSGQRMPRFARGHALDFLHACERTVSAVRERLTPNAYPLAIGCGIASGEL